MFNQIFNDFFNTYGDPVKYGKPIMITETGSCQEYLAPYDQVSFLADAENQLKSNTAYLNNAFAFMYFDGPSQYKWNNQLCHWRFSDSAITKFATIGSDPHFTPMVTPGP